MVNKPAHYRWEPRGISRVEMKRFLPSLLPKGRWLCTSILFLWRRELQQSHCSVSLLQGEPRNNCLAVQVAQSSHFWVLSRRRGAGSFTLPILFPGKDPLEGNEKQVEEGEKQLQDVAERTSSLLQRESKSNCLA